MRSVAISTVVAVLAVTAWDTVTVAPAQGAHLVTQPLPLKPEWKAVGPT
jgi:hypothetical protein